MKGTSGPRDIFTPLCPRLSCSQTFPLTKMTSVQRLNLGWWGGGKSKVLGATARGNRPSTCTPPMVSTPPPQPPHCPPPLVHFGVQVKKGWRALPTPGSLAVWCYGSSQPHACPESREVLPKWGRSSELSQQFTLPSLTVKIRLRVCALDSRYLSDPEARKAVKCFGTSCPSSLTFRLPALQSPWRHHFLHSVLASAQTRGK